MDRKLLEQVWHGRVSEAKVRFDLARNRTNGIVREFPLRPETDGCQAYQHAIQRENTALVEYNRVLRIYTDLVLRGIVPDEDDWQRRKDGSGSGSTG